jgi:hypothetical protein
MREFSDITQKSYLHMEGLTVLIKTHGIYFKQENERVSILDFDQAKVKPDRLRLGQNTTHGSRQVG